MISGLSTGRSHPGKCKFLLQPAVVLTFLVSILSSCQKIEKAYYPNGNLKYRYQLNKDGEMEGVAEFWYENGNPQLTADYRKGKIDGILIRYNEDGMIQSSDEYKEGKLNGISREMHPSGRVKTEKTFVDDIPHGPARQLNESGKVLAEGNYENGFFEGRWLFYDGFDHVIGEAVFSKGDGTMKTYDLDGNIVGITEFRNNKKHGKETFYSTDGKQVRTVYYEDGEPVGNGSQDPVP